MKELTAEEYREALALVAAELGDLNPGDVLTVNRRLAELTVYIETIIGEGTPRIEPGDGLRALRRRRGVTP